MLAFDVAGINGQRCVANLLDSDRVEWVQSIFSSSTKAKQNQIGQIQKSIRNEPVNNCADSSTA